MLLVEFKIDRIDGVPCSLPDHSILFRFACHRSYNQKKKASGGKATHRIRAATLILLLAS